MCSVMAAGMMTIASMALTIVAQIVGLGSPWERGTGMSRPPIETALSTAKNRCMIPAYSRKILLPSKIFTAKIEDESMWTWVPGKLILEALHDEIGVR